MLSGHRKTKKSKRAKTKRKIVLYNIPVIIIVCSSLVLSVIWLYIHIILYYVCTLCTIKSQSPSLHPTPAPTHSTCLHSFPVRWRPSRLYTGLKYDFVRRISWVGRWRWDYCSILILFKRLNVNKKWIVRVSFLYVVFGSAQNEFRVKIIP